MITEQEITFILNRLKLLTYGGKTREITFSDRKIAQLIGVSHKALQKWKDGGNIRPGNEEVIRTIVRENPRLFAGFSFRFAQSHLKDRTKKPWGRTSNHVTGRKSKGKGTGLPMLPANKEVFDKIFIDFDGGSGEE